MEACIRALSSLHASYRKDVKNLLAIFELCVERERERESS